MSWVANLFNPAQPQHLAPSDDRDSPIFSDVQDYEDVNNNILQPTRRKEYAQPMDEEEEAARAPYWHVCG